MHIDDAEPLAPERVTGAVTAVVGAADTAQVLGSGDVPVLGTPRVLALAEAATVSALTRRMPTRWTSLGVEASVRHVAAVAVGSQVTAAVVLRAREGRDLDFEFTVTEAGGRLVATGRIRRRLMERARFLERVGAPVVADSQAPEGVPVRVEWDRLPIRRRTGRPA
nr:thioesterase [Stackebrandtia albiflava]